MTSDDISSSIGAWQERAMFTDTWRSSQKPRRRVVTRATSYDHQILRSSRSVDNKAVLVARVAEIRAGSRESSVARVIVPKAVVRTCGCRWRSDSWALVVICRGTRLSC